MHDQARGLDHFVLAVRDLDAAGRFYERLGFTVSVRNRHPWGTENRIVQFPGTFLELITVGQGADIAPHRPGEFSFGAFVRDGLAGGEGFLMLVLESVGAGADKDSFDSAGIGGFETFHFAREGRRPDGSPVQVAFTLAFARDPLAPGAGFFTCQQHYPENFWNPAFQAHPNGATGVPGVLLAAAKPAEHAGFLSAFTGVAQPAAAPGSLRFDLPRGRIDVLDRSALEAATGLAIPDDSTRLVGFRVAVADITQQVRRLEAAGLPFRAHEGALVVPPGAAFGTAILFEPASLVA